jgi:hypothetical protein
MKQNLDLFQLWKIIFNTYCNQLDSLDSDKLSFLRKTLFDDLDQIIEWMLVTRFLPSKRRPKGILNISADFRRLLIKTGVMKTPQKFIAPKPLDVIKYFKLLENLMLTGKDRRDEILLLQLGQFIEKALHGYDTLPKLLLEVEQCHDIPTRRKILTEVFSLICIYRQFKVSAIHDSSTITNSYDGERSLESLLKNEFSDESIKEWLKTLPIREMRPYLKLVMYSGNASSPNGGASGVNILKDVAAIGNELRLQNAIKNISSFFEGSRDFRTLLDALLLNVMIDKEFCKDAEHSRLVTFTASGGKSRIIAVADWISQTALSGIHFSLFKLLSLMTSDVTFNHPKGLELYSESSSSYVSVDLSAATDRLPRLLQSRLISNIYTTLCLNGNSIATDWLTLMDRSFSTRGSAFEKQSKRLEYAVGQPMGMFSSWTALAITHHYIVNHICKINKDNYRLVGDDLLIKDDFEGYQRYLNVCNAIGMKINPHKTIISSANNCTIEFARNYIIKGLRIKPLPIGVAFAWLNDSCTLENVVWALREHLNHKELLSIYTLIPNYANVERYLLLVYYFFKINICGKDHIQELLSKHQLSNKFNSKLFEYVSDITKSEKSKTWHMSELGGFYSTLKSTCKMRKDDELTRACILAESLQLLGFADDSLIDAANDLFCRLTNASLLTYEIDVSGSPLISKREKLLLLEILASKSKLTGTNLV